MPEGSDHNEDLITVGGYTDFEDDDAALERLVQVKELTFGDVFNDRKTTIESEDAEGLSVSFRHSDKMNQLEIHSFEGGHVHLECAMAGEYVKQAHEILEIVTEEFGDFKVQNVTVSQFFDLAWKTLDMPIQADSKFNISGVRITEADAHYIIQANYDNDDDKLYVNRDRRINDAVTFTEIDPVGITDCEAIEEYLENFR